MASIDPKVFPRTAAYLGRLPGGFAAYPACQIRADFAAIVQKEHVGLWSDPALPPAMRAALARPWREDEWLPVVVISTQTLILQDRRALSDDDVVAASLKYTLTMLDAPLNRAVMRVMSPYVLLMGAAWRWQSFHRGVDIAVLGGDRTSHAVKLTAPPHLLSEVAIRYYGKLFVALIERTRGTDGVVETTRISPTETHYALRWKMLA